MKLEEYASYDGVGLAECVRKGEVTAQELNDLAQQAIDKLNPTLNFMANYENGDQIDPISPTGSNGSLQAVPFLMKEDAEIKGRPISWGSRLCADVIAEQDATITQRFRKSGVTIIGQTTMPEHGNAVTTESALRGKTRNPWNLGYMAGGSSSGSAAAVAAGVVPMASASDGGGSIRIPAACCGLVGLKPSRARTPVAHGGALTLGITHVVSRSLRDTAVMLDCIQGPEVGAMYHVAPPVRSYLEELSIAPRPLRIGFSTQSLSGASVHPDCVKGTLDAVKACEAMGHIVEEVALPVEWDVLAQGFLDLWSYKHPNFIANMERVSGLSSSPDTRETCNLAMLEYGRNLKMSDFVRHINQLTEACVNVAELFTTYDVHITPVTTQPAMKLGAFEPNAPGLTARSWIDKMIDNYAAFTPIYNATGQPAISLPLYQSEAGLPIGVQFAARFGDEATLLQLAGQFEQFIPWKGRKPDTSIF